MNSTRSAAGLTSLRTISISTQQAVGGALKVVKKRSTNKEFTPIGKVLDALLDQYRSDSAGGILNLIRVWRRAVGGPISENAKPFAVNGRLLLVHVTSSVWLHQLHFLKADLLDKLNSSLRENERIEDIKFKIGPV
jgi:predicted nucleic acid-binding Zn ribbon protein